MKTFLIDQDYGFLNWFLLFTSLFLFGYYILFIKKIQRLWVSDPKKAGNAKSAKDQFVSIIIAGRNEGKNLKKCIESVLSGDFPKSAYELIYIDDHSEDDSVSELKKIKSENFKFFELKYFIKGVTKNSYKKAAIELGISQSRGQIILLTDADTIVGSKWIQCHVDRYTGEDRVKFCAAPVIYVPGSNFLQHFQYYDLISTMGFTNAGIQVKRYFMANGANMSFLRNVYEQSSLNTGFASGDDMFLIQKIAQEFPNSVRYIQSDDASVFTYPEKNVKAFISQRIRWGSKSRGYQDKKLKSILVYLFIANLLIILDLIWFSINFNILSFFVFLVLIVKISTEISMIKTVAKGLKQKIDHVILTLSLLLYPFYLVLSGVLSLISHRYTWKGRKVK